MTDTIDPHTLIGPVNEDPTAFAGQLVAWMNGATIILGLDAAHRAGVLEALAETGASTSHELAAQAGLSERHVREWLDLMTVGGVVDHEPGTGRYRLPAGAAMCLTGDSSMNMAPATACIAFSAQHVEAVSATMRHGGGIPYAAYRPDFTDLMDSMNRGRYDQLLIDGYIGAVPGLAGRLRAGIRVADIGCGSGHVVNLLARAFPTSTFVGFDLAEDALEAARLEAAEYGLENATFEGLDVAELPAGEHFDLVVAFDAIHDQARPRTVLAAVRNALADDGMFLMVDVKASSHVEENLDNPMAPWIYGASLFHCMQVSLAEGGEGLGTAWGVQLALQLLGEAGFGDVVVVDPPESDLLNVIYVCRI
jgi:SAM-dependent methyltransferase